MKHLYLIICKMLSEEMIASDTLRDKAATLQDTADLYAMSYTTQKLARILIHINKYYPDVKEKMDTDGLEALLVAEDLCINYLKDNVFKEK